MFHPLFEAVRYENLPHVRIECALPVAPAYGQCRVSCPCQCRGRNTKDLPPKKTSLWVVDRWENIVLGA